MALQKPTMVDLFAAAKANDSEKVISLLSNVEVDWPSLLRKELQEGLWVLETALKHNCLEAANILACYEIMGLDYIKNKKPNEIVATKSIWCSCLSNAVYGMKKINKKSLRAPKNRGAHLYASRSYYCREDEKNEFYYVVRDHYSKLLTLSDAIEPGAFIALVRLNDDFRNGPEGLTLPMHVLMSKAKKDHKLAMLKFILHFDKAAFTIPSGPEGLLPAVYCLKTNNVMLFSFAVVGSMDYLGFRSKDGKDIMSYTNNRHFELFYGEERKTIYNQLNGALNTFLMRNMTAKKQHRFYDADAIRSLETLANLGKHNQVQEFADIVNDRVIGAYMAQLGYKSANLDQYKCTVVSTVEKLDFVHEAQSSFEFINLPNEILEIIMTNLTVQDIVHLFMISKQIHQSYSRFDSNSLWKMVLANTKISLEGDIPMKTDNYKGYVMNCERYKKNWRKGKYQEKVLLQTSEFLRHWELDDNWLCCVHDSKAIWKNLNADQVYQRDFAHDFKFLNHCFIESTPIEPALVALYNTDRYIHYGRINEAFNSIVLPETHFGRRNMYPVGNDRLIISGRTHLIDLKAQKVIVTGPNLNDVMPNPFNRSMAVSYDWNSVKIIDENLVVVQTMSGLNITRSYGLIDEFTLALGTGGNEIVLYDVRKLEPKQCQVLLKDVHTVDGVSVDIRNQRMIAETGPYKMTVQMDLKTREWERIWKPMEHRYYNTYPLINDRYMLRRQSGMQMTKFCAYDFSGPSRSESGTKQTDDKFLYH